MATICVFAGFIPLYFFFLPQIFPLIKKRNPSISKDSGSYLWGRGHGCKEIAIMLLTYMHELVGILCLLNIRLKYSI